MGDSTAGLLYGLAICLLIGTVAGAVIGLVVSVLARGRLQFRHFLWVCGWGMVGAAIGVAAILAFPGEMKPNGLLASLLGPDPDKAALFVWSGAASASLVGCVGVLIRSRHGARA